MSKHKLFKQDDCSPLIIGRRGSMTPKEKDSQHNKPKTPDQGLKRKKLQITPVTVKFMRRKHANEYENENYPAFLCDSETPEPSTSKNLKFEPESVRLPKLEKVNPDSALDFVDDFDADDADFFLKNNQKIPYTYQEDEMIIKYVLKGQNIFRVSSISLWKNLEMRKIKPKRTYQSLKNRFLRNIKPNLFTTYKHLIDNQDVIEKILLKFPELKKQMGTKRLWKQISVFDVNRKSSEEVGILNSSMKNSERTQRAESSALNTKPEEADSFALSPCNSPKTSKFERIIKFSKDSIKVSVNSNNFNDLEVPFSSYGLSERFKKLKMNNERVPCPTCGRFYRRPLPNDLSESDAESDIIIPDSVEADIQNASFVRNKKTRSVGRRMSSRSRSSPNTSVCQNLLASLEKSDKSDANSEDTNSVPEEVSERDEVEEIIEIVDMPIKDMKSKEDKTTDSDSDIDLIYEHTVERFHKLIGANEDQTLQRKCLNKDQNGIGFNANAEKNLDSFFLETPQEADTPAFTNEFRSQVQVNSRRTQSQRVTRSSALASNMMKMLGKKLDSEKNSQG